MPDDDDKLASSPSSLRAEAITAQGEGETPGEGEGPARSAARLPIVGIGTSAGGLEALEAVLRRLTTDGMAYVIMQHLLPGHESLLPDILSRATPMRVTAIRDAMPVEPNVIYVAPPDANVALERGTLRLTPLAGTSPRHTIDSLFRTLAADRGPMAIGVVLSGAGTDGTLGLRAIKDEGGITFVQEPSGAGHASMPQSAVDAGVADFCLSPTEIGDELMRLASHPFVARKRPARLWGEDSMRRIFDRLRRGFGVDFGAYKQSTIERRIVRRMALQKVERVEEYIHLIETNVEELNMLYSDLLIGVTAFFRDAEPFQVLKEVLFPRLLEKRSPDRPIRIWVAGCATGEEAYSVAISLLEYLGDRAWTFQIQIFATDIDEQALDKARAGLYPPGIDLDVSPDRIQRFFSRQEKGYQVARHVRDLIVFARHTLGKDPPFSRLDLVTCRNVLIYMQARLQRRVLRTFHYALNPDAFLLLGTSESLGDAAELFMTIERRVKIYQKKDIPATAAFDLAFGARLESEQGPPAPAPQFEQRPVITMQQLADRKVIERYGPPGVLLNEQMEVIQFRGQTAPYIAPAPGAATFNILKLVRPELLIELRPTLQQARQGGVPVTSGPIRLSESRGSEVFIDVVPMTDAAVQRKCLLVLFREVPIAPQAAAHDAPGEAAPRADGARKHDQRIGELERELLTTKEYLQTTVQELEATNEELQSSNEELQSANEELQSANEELETSKEELQSTNEELATVNEELQNRMVQLAVSNDDLQNLLATVSGAIVLIGMDLRIRRFTAAAEKLFNLISTDVGRPVGYLGNTIKGVQIEAIVSETIHAVSNREQRVRCSEGNWYTLRTAPYQTADHTIRGAILELVRTPPAKRGETSDVPELDGKILSALPDPIVLLNGQLRITWCNKRFFEVFRYGAEILGVSLDELWPTSSENEPFWRALSATAAGGEAFHDMDVLKAFGRADAPPMLLTGFRISPDSERPSGVLITGRAR